MMKRRNIIINGGTRGIGLEVVKYLAKNMDNKIVVTGRNEQSLSALVSQHDNVKSFALDMSSFESECKDFINMISKHFKEVNILINLAGFLTAKGFTETSTMEARLTMETNFFGPALLIKSLKPLMPKGSHIVNISSMGGFQGSVKFRGLSYYSASKAAMSCLTECLANEFSESGISVNCLALGAVQTEMLSEAFPGYKAPVEANEMAEFISEFALTGNKFFNGKILPVAVGTP
jgi:NAD(P)-dependent dehydrogenase (short-subunit alcohol dehydrogenase family)